MAKALFPPGSQARSQELRLSPGIFSGNHVFVTGMSGSRANGTMPPDPDVQFRNAFDKIGLVLNQAGLSFGSIVEMTSYHIGLRGHFELFEQVRAGYVKEPYPAWTAVEVAGLRRVGALVEIRVIAEMAPR